MRRDLLNSFLGIVVLTIVLGLAYPLAFTGIAQVLFPNKADGSKVTVNGQVVGSKLIAQSFGHDPNYFHSRPSQTGYDPSATGFSNNGPNSNAEGHVVRTNLAAYLKIEGPYNPDLTAAGVPVDAITQSASGVDPHISVANARIQAHRIAELRNLDLARVNQLIDDNTDGRGLGLFGEPGVNVLELNIALDREAPVQ